MVVGCTILPCHPVFYLRIRTSRANIFDGREPLNFISHALACLHTVPHSRITIDVVEETSSTCNCPHFVGSVFALITSLVRYSLLYSFAELNEAMEGELELRRDPGNQSCIYGRLHASS